MKLILLGAPGAQEASAEILCDKLGIPTISTGNILRAAVKEGTPMGKRQKVLWTPVLWCPMMSSSAS